MPGDDSAAGLLVGVAQLSDVVAKPCLDISWFVEPTLEQFLDSRLGSGAAERGEKGVPLGCDLRVGRQAVHVDQTFRLRERLFVERRNSCGKCVDEGVEFGVGQGAVDVSVEFRQLTADIVGTEQTSKARPRPIRRGSRAT